MPALRSGRHRRIAAPNPQTRANGSLSSARNRAVVLQPPHCEHSVPHSVQSRHSDVGTVLPSLPSRSHDRIAVVDVGSTSFKLLVATLDPATNSLVSLYEEKRQVKLLSGTEFSTISESAMDRALNAIGHFTAVATKYGVPLQAIATAGLRDAADSASLVQAVQEKFGLTIQVISAQCEAVFVYNGAMLSAVAPMEPAMCMDIGGGSTEVCCGHSGRPTAMSCISLGSSKLANEMPKLSGEGVADREEMMQCMHRVREYLKDADTSAVQAALARIEQEGKLLPVYGTSGTIKCIANLIATQHGAVERLEGPLTPFTRGELQQFIQSLEGTTRAERMRLGAMKKKRVDAVVPGAILLLEMMNLLGIDDMAASITGLREGVVSAYLRPFSPLHSRHAPLISGEAGAALSALKTVPTSQSDGHVPLRASLSVGV